MPDKRSGSAPRQQRTQTVLKLFGGRLRLELRPPRQNYYARICIQGKLLGKSTGETRLPAAKRAARKWFESLLARTDRGESVHAKSFGDVAEKFLKYQDDVEHVSKGQRDNYHDKWSVLKPYVESERLEAVDLRFLEDLRERRYQASLVDQKTAHTDTPVVEKKKQQPVSASTLKKDFIFIRLVLKHAIERERCLDRLPVFPSFGQQKWKILPKSRPFFSADDYKTLKAKAQARIKETDNPRVREQRRELYDFILMCVGGCLRVDEARNLRFKDVTIGRHNAEAVLFLKVLGKHSPDGRTREDGYGMYGAVPAFRRIRKRRPNAGPDELLFVHHHRDSFRELLTACGMRQTDRGKRDLKSLRPTGISLRLDKGPKNIDMRALARVVRTSPEMIHKFYDQTHPSEMLGQVMGFREQEQEGGKKSKSSRAKKETDTTKSASPPQQEHEQ
jgi:integrase